MQGLSGFMYRCRMPVLVFIQAPGGIAKRNILPKFASRSSGSIFKTNAKNIHVVQTPQLVRFPLRSFFIDRKVMSMTANPERNVDVEWIQEAFDLVPQWTIEPDLEMIKQVVSSAMFSSQEISVTFLTQGTLNKIYNVRIGEDNFIMRVSLPVEPRWKTLSEVATVEWVRRNTRLPVPQILAHDESRGNVIGFEWILMSKLPGSPLADVWRTMQFPAKKKLVQELAIYSSALFKKQLRGIGNIYAIPRCEREDDGDGDSDGDDLPEVKRIVSMQFFWGNRLLLPIPRGPFRCSKDWIAARLSCNEHECHSILSRCNQKEEMDSDDEDNFQSASVTLNIINRLKPLLSDIFPSDEQDDAEPEPSILFHDDLSRQNILVDDAGDLTGVVDWECVSALPLWKACYYPRFLETRPRTTEPNRDGYERYEGDDEEEPGTLYWEHLLEYESTMLRQYFLDEMRRLEPGWIKVFEASQVKRDFDFAADYCDDEFCWKSINKWIDDIASEKANPRSLQEILHARFDPQAYLGLVINWGIPLGWAAVRGDLSDRCAIFLLYASGILWSIVYDTIYAHQDKEADRKIGVKSTALLFGHKPRIILTGFSLGSLALLALAGFKCGLGLPFYCGVVVSSGHLVWQLYTVALDDPADCSSNYEEMIAWTQSYIACTK